MQKAIYVNVHAFAEAVQVLLVQLKTHHATVIARKNEQEYDAWSKMLKDIHVNLRQSFLDLPSELHSDHPDVCSVAYAMADIAQMSNECKAS